MKDSYKKLTLLNMDELAKASDSIGACIGSLNEIEPFVPLSIRVRHLKTVKYLRIILDEIDRIIIEATDADERMKPDK